MNARFWAKVTHCEASDCWLWSGAIGSGGYGNLSWQGRSANAHRVAWVLSYGEIEPGMFVLHVCDVKRCVNPRHLFLGDHRQNMADMAAKGRARAQSWRGSANGRAVLTEEVVTEMRRRYARGGITMASLCREFGVGLTAGKDAIRGRRWAHVEVAA